MRRFKKNLKTSLRSVLITLLVVGGLIATNDAKADPHAVFYTAIGQQQLFFNVLAALDQADYVEPKTGSFSRDELVSKRGKEDAVPPFAAEDLKLITATNTELSSVITRPITLEGNDLYTDFLIRRPAVSETSLVA